MDLLASLNIEDLPEQQTRTKELIERFPEFELRLGFDACCACGRALEEVPSTVVPCPSCRRVKYCSESCREQDASTETVALSKPPDSGDGEEETALGHTSVICAVLNVCDDDEAVEDNKADRLDPGRLQAAQDRVRSELESYPATLANVIAGGPCYQRVLNSCSSSSAKKLTIHIIGASVDSEFWDTNDEPVAALNAYAEALADLAEKMRLDTIELVFIGPESPEKNLDATREMRSSVQDKVSGVLHVRSIKSPYTNEVLERGHIDKAHIVVFFNPGFTVPDYDWRDALASIEDGTPFLSTTNTELEGIADCQYLLDQDKIQSMPPGLADIFGLYSPADDDDEARNRNDDSSFFNVNPFSGTRVRQSGTMGNDLYVKNRWILGGIMGSFDPSKTHTDAPVKKQRTLQASSNVKAGNPALI